MAQQIIIEDAGVPGAANSYYSSLQILEAAGDAGSPPVAGFTVVPDVGFIFFADLGATLSVMIRTDDSPATYVTLIAAGGQGQLWSDGSNIFVQNAAPIASPELTVSYYVVAQKP